MHQGDELQERAVDVEALLISSVIALLMSWRASLRCKDGWLVQNCK
jgi:hypothetical protein